MQSKKYFLQVIAILFMFLVAPAVVRSQDFRPGFVVLSGGDTLRGEVNLRGDNSNETTCTFRPKNGERTTYFPWQVKGYGVDENKTYVSKELGIDSVKRTVFAQVLVGGFMNLYSYNGIFYVEKRDTIYELDGKKTTVIRDDKEYVFDARRFAGTLKLLMADCGINPDDAIYAEQDLSKWVRKYNKCKTGKTVIYKESLPNFAVRVSVMASAGASSLTMEGYEEWDISSGVQASGGLEIEISNPNLNDKASLSLGAWYVPKTYVGHWDHVIPGYEEHRTMVIDVRFLKILFSVNYFLRKRTSSPYLKLGGAWSFVTNDTKAKITVVRDFGSSVSTNTTEYTFHAQNSIGIWGGLGYNHQFGRRLGGFAEFRYEINNGFTGNNPFYSSSGNWNIVAGISF